MDRLASLESECPRLKKMLAELDKVTVCCLGNSAIGKRAFLSAVVVKADQLPSAAGIGPPTAAATNHAP